MKVLEIVQALPITLYCGEELLDTEVSCGYACDLLSCVMGNAPAACVWVTVQGHLNSIAVAMLREIPCIILSEGNLPAADTVEKAKEEGIILLGTKENSYQVACRLCTLGLHG